MIREELFKIARLFDRWVTHGLQTAKPNTFPEQEWLDVRLHPRSKKVLRWYLHESEAGLSLLISLFHKLRGASGGRVALGEAPPIEPPVLAEFIISALMERMAGEALLGDMDEIFQEHLARGMSVKHAKIRYWGQAIKSIAPLLWALAKRTGLVLIVARILH
jgi:hypothetical protein